MKALLMGPGVLKGELETKEVPYLLLPVKKALSVSFLMSGNMEPSSEPSFIKLKYRNTFLNNIYEFEGFEL